MNAPAPRLTLLTLGVKDIAASAAFYEALGFRRKARGSDGVAFFEAGGLILSLWSAEQLAEDAKVAPKGSGFRGVSLAWNCTSPADVDAALERAVTLGAKRCDRRRRCSGAATPATSPIPMGTSGRSRTTRTFR